MGTHSYAYDGDGRRISKSVSSTVTQYLLNLHPGLANVTVTTTGANTDRHVHSIDGIHAKKSSAGVWSWMLNDGQGSMRLVMGTGATVPTETRQYGPFGTEAQILGSAQTEFGYTGEQRDGNHLINLRARHYNPALGVFPSRDPFEGATCNPMSLNGYSWLEGNTINHTDPSGEFWWLLLLLGLGALALATLLSGCNLTQTPEETPTPTPTPNSPTATSTPTSTVTSTSTPNSPTATSTPTSTVTPTSTPMNCSVFGCSAASMPVDYGTGHIGQANAVDLEPLGVTTGSPTYNLLNDSWPTNNNYANLAAAHSFVSGTAEVFVPLDRICNGCEDVRVRTGDGVCYQFKHLVPSVKTGDLISIDQLLGTVILDSNDPTHIIGAGTQSHLHIDRYMCDVNFIQVSGVISGDIRDVVPYLVNR